MGSSHVRGLKQKTLFFFQCFLAANHGIQFHFALMTIEDIACYHQTYTVYASVFEVCLLSLKP